MKKLSFKKGWLPLDGLAFTGDRDFPREPVLEIFTPREIALPMLQHSGTPAIPTVREGDRVTVGSIVGKPSSVRSAPVHAGISGMVTGIETVRLADNTSCKAVIIHNDLKRELHSSVKKRMYPDRIGRDDLWKLLDYSGVVGMGRDGIPTAFKCRNAERIGVETLLVNACQSEPYLTCDIHLLREQTERVIQGAFVLSGLCRVKRVVFCLLDKWETELSALQNSFHKYREHYPDRDLGIRLFRSRFPQGFDKLLIKALYDVELPVEASCEEAAGVVIFNASTCAAVWDMVERNQPLTSRVISISSDTAIGHNVLVPIGTRVSEILERVPGAASARRIIMGGAITGTALRSTEVSVTKTTSGIIMIRNFEPPKTACIHCGACVDACPVGLLPYLCEQLLRADEGEAIKRENIRNCISCGACSYVCPAGIDLSARIGKAAERSRRDR
ncbi:MAG: RnfABCDGE type electron transport complex subunit C [Oscillospiraceae bacterium]|nr:RnfABCDGE type electron transport complex subunit C [Clostridiales bacterium]MDD4094742.1 RnfABCDGE type electron transport complex subunit C [Oscillospiraceae bacterium]